MVTRESRTCSNRMPSATRPAYVNLAAWRSNYRLQVNASSGSLALYTSGLSILSSSRLSATLSRFARIQSS